MYCSLNGLCLEYDKAKLPWLSTESQLEGLGGGMGISLLSYEACSALARASISSAGMLFPLY